jgi:hypothetical protein
MTKRMKKWLFRGAVVLFFLLSPVVILYAQGYKYSFQDRQFYLTGTLALKANIDAKIYIDGQLEGDTSFFGNAFNKNGLLPGTYELVAQKDGYHRWRKEVQVQEGLVTDFARVVLLPVEGQEHEDLVLEVQNIFAAIASASLTPTPTATPRTTPGPRVSPTPTPLTEPFIIQNAKLYQNINQQLTEISSGVKGFLVSPDENKIAYWSNNELWVMWLRNQNYQPYQEEGDRHLITRFSLPINSVGWFRDEDHLVVRFGNNNYNYRITETDTRGGINIVEI